MDKGVLAAGLATVFIGFNIVILSVLTKLVNPIVVLMLSFLLSLIFLVPLLYGTKERLHARKLFKDFKKELAELIVFRSIIGSLLLFFGFSMTLAIRALFFVRIEPLFVLIFGSLLLKERITSRKISLIIILLIGAFIFATNLNPNVASEIMIGDLLVVFAMVFLAYSYVPSSKMSKQVSPTAILIVSNLIAGLIFVPIALSLPSTLVLGGYEILLLFANVITFYVFGLFLWFRALKEAKPWIVSSILALEPIAGSILAFLWLGQILTPVQFVGGGIMILATYFIGRENIKV